MEFEQKKMAIEQGLTPFLSGESLGDAMQLWKTKYSGDPTFALVRFVNELCEHVPVTAPSTKILQSLIRALNKAPDPTPARRDQTAQITEFRGIQGDAVRACLLLVDTLVDRLPLDRGADVRQYMLDHLNRLQQPEPILNAIRAWLSQRQTIVMPITEKALTRIINLAYVALCEYEGPAKADRALHEAVQIVEKSTVGSEFPIQRLL